MDRGEIRLKPTVDQGNNHKHSAISLQSRHSDADEWAMVQIFRVDSDTATLRVGEGFTKRRRLVDLREQERGDRCWMFYQKRSSSQRDSRGKASGR